MMQSYSRDLYVFLVCCAGIILLFIATSLSNFVQKRQGKTTSSHVSSVIATKVTNFIVITALLIPAFSGSYTIYFSDFVYALIVINAAAFINWNFYALTDTSMHIHILTEVYRADDITENALLKRYNKNSIIRARVPRLLALRQLKLENGMLRLSGNTVLYGAEMCKIFRRLLNIPVRPPIDEPIRPLSQKSVEINSGS